MTSRLITARNLLEHGDLDAAREELRAILSADPDCRPAAALLADAERRAYRREHWHTYGKRRLQSLVVCALFIGGYLVWRLWPDPENERVARALVEQTYAMAQAEDTSGMKSRLREDEKRYGRIVNFRITGSRPTIWTHWTRRHYFTFDVETVREHAVLHEVVQARAGPSSDYGYVRYVRSIDLLSITPR